MLIAATAKQAKRVDYEYERAGTATIFIFAEPVACWREVAVRERKTKIDWATEMARLLEGRYAECAKVILVCDNLNTHTKGRITKRSTRHTRAAWSAEWSFDARPSMAVG